MIALMILGCHVMKDVGQTRNRADLELLTALSKHAAKQYTESGQHPKFVEAITILQQQIQDEVYKRDTNDSRSPETLREATSTSGDMERGLGNVHEWAYSIPGEWNSVFGDYALDDPWSFLQGDIEMGNMTNL